MFQLHPSRINNIDLTAYVFPVTLLYRWDIANTSGVHEDIDRTEPVFGFLDDASNVVRLCAIESRDDCRMWKGICQILHRRRVEGGEDHPMALPESSLGQG